MRKTHAIHFHGKTYCGLSYYADRKPDLSEKSPTCKRCEAGLIEYLCIMLQVTAEILEEQAQRKADELAAPTV